MNLQDRNVCKFQQGETDLFEAKISCGTSNAIHKNTAKRSDGDSGSETRNLSSYNSGLN